MLLCFNEGIAVFWFTLEAFVIEQKLCPEAKTQKACKYVTGE